MRTFKTAFSLLSLALISAPLYAAPVGVQFKGQARFVSDAPMEKINGTGAASGEVTFDADAPEALTGKITVPLTSMETGNAKRDEHLRGSDWLDASKCPDIKYEFQGAKLLDKKSKGDVTAFKLEVQGNFTVHCVSKPLTTVVNLKKKGALIKVMSSFDVALKDHEIKGKAGIVGSKVGNSVKASVALKGKAKGAK